MIVEGLRKYSSTLFHGKNPIQAAKWSGRLPDHKNLTNHQLCIVASGIVTAGVYAVHIIPDTDREDMSATIGLTLDLTGKNSAMIRFTGVIKGIRLFTTTPITDSVTLSAVLSSFSRYKRSHEGSAPRPGDRLDYVSSTIAMTRASGFSDFTANTENHRNMIYHQIALSANNALADQYRVRIIPESEYTLEASVDTGRIIDFNNTESAFVYFGGVMQGIHLEAITAPTAGSIVSMVLSSTVERSDEIIYDFIGDSPTVDDHVGDLNNPHQTSWDNLLNKPEVFPNHEVLRIPLTIPNEYQLLIWEKFEIDGGALEVAPGGKLIILHDRPETELTGPDFTYNGSGELTQIDYDNGEQKLFTYTAGDLIRVDTLIDGTTLRKDFYYGGGGELDYIDEYYVYA